MLPFVACLHDEPNQLASLKFFDSCDAMLWHPMASAIVSSCALLPTSFALVRLVPKDAPLALP